MKIYKYQENVRKFLCKLGFEKVFLTRAQNPKEINIDKFKYLKPLMTKNKQNQNNDKVAEKY